MDKFAVEVECPACIGSGRVEVGTEDYARCRGCFGAGKIEVFVDDEHEDALWDEAIETLTMVGVDKHPEAWNYGWRDGWKVIDFDEARRGGVQ